MDKNYWLARKRASAAMARRSTSSRGRLVQFDLAGRYSLKAAQCRPFLLDATASPAGERAVLAAPVSLAGSSDAAYYGRLQAGAAFLAEQAADPADRAEHLEMARIYGCRAREAAASARRAIH